MRCENCGRETNNIWGFCPHCGYFSGEFGDNFANIARMLGGKAMIKQEGDSFIVILDIQGTRHAFRITPINLEEVSNLTESSAQAIEPEHKPSEPRKKRGFEKTEEPEMETNYVEDRIYMKVNLKEISEKDIEIEELENSIEIRAYKGKTRYFKLVPIPEGYHLVSTECLSGEVIITLGKE